MTGLVRADQLQPKGGLMAQADRLGPEVGGHLALWAAFISPRPFSDSRVVLRRVRKRNCWSYYYRAMHFSAKRGIAIACHLSVCDVGEV